VNGGALVLPANGTVGLRMNWANCQGEPPVPCQVYTTALQLGL